MNVGSERDVPQNRLGSLAHERSLAHEGSCDLLLLRPTPYDFQALSSFHVRRPANQVFAVPVRRRTFARNP